MVKEGLTVFSQRIIRTIEILQGQLDQTSGPMNRAPLLSRIEQLRETSSFFPLTDEVGNNPGTDQSSRRAARGPDPHY